MHLIIENTKEFYSKTILEIQQNILTEYLLKFDMDEHTSIDAFDIAKKYLKIKNYNVDVYLKDTVKFLTFIENFISQNLDEWMSTTNLKNIDILKSLLVHIEKSNKFSKLNTKYEFYRSLTVSPSISKSVINIDRND